MPDNGPVFFDKMPLKELVVQTAGDLLSAFEEIERDHPGWEVGAVPINVRGVLKPGKLDGKWVVYYDIDEPAHVATSDIPIPLRRKGDPAK